ncbi:MAG: AbrB/MazE/SpoVT family DNA-binding domain-containing protein [Gammaproteobacteria bacterium]|nr:AbrB/MazE/SpoVT family DNA-binding domain-containing protein [Gammaproteobacteria bacterium]
MIITLTVTAEGQVKLPEDVLRHFGVRPGDKLSVELLNDQRIELRPKPGEPASKLFGMLKQPNMECLTIEEISDSAAAGWAGEV